MLVDVKNILKSESELWLAYLYGQKLAEIPHLTKSESRLRGVFFRLLVYLRFLIINTRIPSVKIKSSDYLIYCGSENQKEALNSTILALKRKKKSFITITNPITKFAKLDEDNLEIGYFSTIDILSSLILLTVNWRRLRSELRNIHPQATNRYFNTFCSVYTYLCYFLRILRQVKPEYVIVSNDHNPQNRCLLAVAHYLKIKTIYMQHASVSSLFPALRVNYAFLDGEAALNVYRNCEINQPSQQRSVPEPIVFLSGQKKVVYSTTNRTCRYVGIAVNLLDDPDNVISLIVRLTVHGFLVCVRWHPRLDNSRKVKYSESFSKNDCVTISDPAKDSLEDYFVGLTCLVAGNSSIHLEAALQSIPTIHFDFSGQPETDYYGYIKAGLAVPAKDYYELLKIILSFSSGKCAQSNAEAVRYFSETYDTPWEGKEGELVVETIDSINKGIQPSLLFGYRHF